MHGEGAVTKPPSRRESYGGLWCDFQSLFSDFAGVSVQAFDEKGAVVQPSSGLPDLCALFQRFPETSAACQKDCLRKAATCRDSRKIVAARCYAGLNYRILPIRKRNRLHSIILVGRVLGEVFGSEQCLGFLKTYKVPRASFLQGLSGMRIVSDADLNRVATFVRRVAVSLVAAETRFEHRHALLGRRQGLLNFARSAARHDRSPGQTGRLLEELRQLLAASGAAVVLSGEEGAPPQVHASAGLSEDALRELSRQDLEGGLLLNGRAARLILPDWNEHPGNALELSNTPIVARRLMHGNQTLGHLLISGKVLQARDLDLLEAASDFLAARIVHERCRERAERKDEETQMLGLMAERCLTAHSVEELLPLALEAAMHSLHARRGSILLAEERGRITARALRGDHAPISESIDALYPGSVSHEVFFNRHPLLVQDADRELGLTRERQFPYATRSFVSVPLRENGHALGVLHLTEREGEAVFTPEDLSLLERLSVQASGAICKARLEEEVKALRVASATDHLTGVSNRRHLEEQLVVEFQRAQRFGQPLAVVMLDLDGFKSLNDELGHARGDRVLREVAGVARRQLRTMDILARYGGDEFVLVLPGTDAAGALSTIEKIRRCVRETEVPGITPARSVTVSAGLSIFPGSAASAADLLQRADEALFQAKRSGRNSAHIWAGH